MVRVVDAKGAPCPQPVIIAKKALQEITEGTLEVLVDNEMAVQNLEKLGRYSGLKTESRKVSEKEYKVEFTIVENSEGIPAAVPESAALENVCCSVDTEEQPAAIPAGRKEKIVVLSSDQMGSGNEELGKILMKGFVYALTQLEESPAAILLYNGGAKLSVEGAETLEDLKNLEEQGVEILTCGTCLNYYGLSEKLRVGTVTNMYEITERMTKADSVVRP